MKELDREERKSLLFGEPVKIPLQKPVTFPTDHPGPEDKRVPEGTAYTHSPHSEGSQFSVAPRELSLNGFTMCKLFWRVAGRLLSAARVRTETNPSESHSW